MSLRFDLRDRPALVTGASGGLGAHFARTLAAHGAPVALAARRAERLHDVARDIEAAGGRAVAIAMDVTDARSVADAFAAAQAAIGTVRVLVNNSGIAAPAAAIQTSEEDWDRVLDTNLKGAFLAAKECAQRLIDAGESGSIINIASILSFRVGAGLASYAASKAALRQLTCALALELARSRIRVNAIAPGYIATDMNRDFFASEPGLAMIRRIPQRRLGQPEDLDGVLLLLASDASDFMTGSTLVVDGGHLVAGL
jgi:NAD(P)-dependent dehydrogenase (short-subunit alcohol dehydrogenase family)